jgi:phosphoglycerate dehydrogenase-like enzyme
MIVAVSPSFVDPVRAAVPSGVEVHGLDGDAIPPDVTFLVPGWEQRDSLEGLAELPELRVVQVMSAGTDAVERFVPPWVTLCNARGTRDGAVAEWCLGALLGTASGLLEVAHSRTWESRRHVEVSTWTVVIIGFGSIGRTLARHLDALGATTIGIASRARDGVLGPESLPEVLPAADAVVILAPLTEDTRGLVDADFLGRMRDDALLVGAGRGAQLDMDALTAELASGRLRAVLDVTDPEPLPADHPLWHAAGALAITPHIGGSTAAADLRAARFAGEQAARLYAGEPLENVVRAGDAAARRA